MRCSVAACRIVVRPGCTLTTLLRSYWVAALSLHALLHGRTASLALHLSRAQWLAESLHSAGVLRYYESCSQATLANAFRALRRAGVLQAQVCCAGLRWVEAHLC